MQQETQTAQISQDADNVMMNVEQGNQQLDQAVVKARAARRKKWICLGICGTLSLSLVETKLIVDVSSYYHCDHYHCPHSSRCTG